MRAFLVSVAATIAALGLGSACGGSGSDENSGFGGGPSGGSSSGGTPSGGSGQIVGGTSGGFGIGGANSGGTGQLGDAACAASSYEGEIIPLDMFIMYDQSGSMNEQTPNGTVWDVIKGALIQFVQSPQSAGIGVGIGYFPLVTNCTPNTPGCTCIFGICPPQSSCNATEYARPDVPIEVLPQVEPKIVASLNAHGPNGGTPTYPAIQGAMQYALQYAVANVGRKTIVVLATDGAPNDCNSNVQNVSSVAAAGFANNPQLLTFVVGIGNTGNLNQIAQAGGTNQALIVSTSANAGQEFLDAMNRIRGQALSCEFGIPTPRPGETLNPNQVNVRFTPGGAAGEIIFKVDNAGACDPNLGGWYYDDPAAPQRILLCPASCNRVTATPGRIDVELGCSTVTIPK
jgi:hypothetical protein